MYRKGDLVSYNFQWYVVAECFAGKANGEPMLRIHRDGKEGIFAASQVSPSQEVVDRITRGDAMLEEIWKDFENVPIDDDHIDTEWRWWPDGTPLEDIWKWFDKHHSKGLKYLMHGEEG